uniref:Uncharacterized protein n=1 Tax=Romanomermis culicivorax TaxID=13658 RepID=A0A915IDE8_ROMCU
KSAKFYSKDAVWELGVCCCCAANRACTSTPLLLFPASDGGLKNLNPKLILDLLYLTRGQYSSFLWDPPKRLEPRAKGPGASLLTASFRRPTTGSRKV